jgi:tetratricopeptide (TPR) repeat protein
MTAIMKRSRLTIVLVILTVLIGILAFLFLTRLGWSFQYDFAARHELPAYKRLLLHLVTSKNTPGAYHFAAEEYLVFSYEDIRTARDMADRAIESNPNDTMYHVLRGRINMRYLHYAEAATDFGYALYCWQDGFDMPSKTSITNSFLRAQALQRAWEKAPPDPVTQSWAEYYDRTIKEFPDDPFWYYSRARERMLAGCYAEAKADIESSLHHWRPAQGMPSRDELTNALIVATGYLEASMKVTDMHIEEPPTH